MDPTFQKLGHELNQVGATPQVEDRYVTKILFCPPSGSQIKKLAIAKNIAIAGFRAAAHSLSFLSHNPYYSEIARLFSIAAISKR